MCKLISPGGPMPTTEVPYWLLELIKKIFLKFPDDARRRGGHLSAVSKYAQRDALLLILQEMQDDGIDITPTFAKRIMIAWTGRSADWKTLLKVFGKPGRKADRKSKDFDRFEELAEKWKDRALRKRKEAYEHYQLAVAQARFELVTDDAKRDFSPMPQREAFLSKVEH